jgi:23S rRNA (cytosine1962-C5)-methyltransferase
VAVIRIKAGHVQPVWAGHPWVYAQAVDRVDGGAMAGDEVVVEDARGNALGRGLYSPRSAIPVRLYTRDSRVSLDAALVRERLERALELRAALGLPNAETNAYRLVHGEGDDLPGLIVDRFANTLVVQFGSIGMKRREGTIFDALWRLLEPRAIVDRTSARVAESEAFELASGVVRGDTALAALEFVENGLRYELPLELGQKTGFYLDQRALRARVQALAQGRRVLDAFCYVGAFSLAAARGGAISVDRVVSSAAAIEIAGRSAVLNGLESRARFQVADAHEALKRLGKAGAYDLVICDPPKLAPNRSSAKRALDHMRRLASVACRATRPSGLCILCSCSSAIGMDELTRAMALGAREASRRPVVLEQFSQGLDHPVPAAFPEGRYLSTIICASEPL